MKTEFATSWKKSVQPRKQRKYAYNAPHHVRGKFLTCHLSKELHEKHKVRSKRVRTGDTVKILRGSFRGKTGKVDHVDMKHTRIFITKMERKKPDGSVVMVGMHPSNVVITELHLDDKKRKAKLSKE